MSNLFVVSGPSGSGKSSICRQVVAKDNCVKLSISATTRAPRGEEKNGVEYFFLSVDEFENKIENKEFYEYARVYNNLYGTLRSHVDELLAKGNDVILEIDVQGGLQIKALNEKAKLIFIMPPSMEELIERLSGRETETEAQIKVRIGNAQAEISEKEHYDYIVVNDKLDVAVDDVLSIINNLR